MISDSEVLRFHHYLWEHGFDPIGASDIIRDAVTWLRGQSVEWVGSHSPAEWYAAFAAAEIARPYDLQGV